MSLGTEVGLGPGDIVLDGDPSPPKKGHRWMFSAASVCLFVSVFGPHSSFFVRKTVLVSFRQVMLLCKFLRHLTNVKLTICLG